MTPCGCALVNDSGWRQWSAPAGAAEIFIHENLVAIPEVEQTARIAATHRMLQQSLDISLGPLMKFAYFNLGSGRSGRLLAVGHRLVVDNLSWQILLEDLETVYHQLERKEPVRLPRKTSSFKQWAE